MKRFYKNVSVGSGPDGCQILLDGRPVRTPEKAVLVVGSKPLADAVASEWDAQVQDIAADTMPVTRLVTTAIDLMPARRQPAENEINEYVEMDMLCYRCAEPQALADQQAQLWQPWLDWAMTALDAPLTVTAGINPQAQPPHSLRAIANHISSLDDWRLVGVHAATKLTGSAILALAMERQLLTYADAHRLSLLDELFEISHWGLDDEQAKRHDQLSVNLHAVEIYLAALTR